MHDSINGSADLTVAPGAEHAVDLRKTLEDVLLIALRETARNDDLFEQTGLFQLRKLQNVVNCLTFCAVNKAAGVYDRNVTACRITDQLMPCLIEQIQHLLAVDQIFGTAE